MLQRGWTLNTGAGRVKAQRGGGSCRAGDSQGTWEPGQSLGVHAHGLMWAECSCVCGMWVCGSGCLRVGVVRTSACK